MVLNNLSIINYIIGKYYSNIHAIFIISVGLILVLSNNITYLCIIAILLFLEVLINATFHDCPLNIYELKYSNTSGKMDRAYKSFNAGIVYKCGHYYENQLDLIINVFLGILGKLALITCIEVFGIRIYHK